MACFPRSPPPKISVDPFENTCKKDRLKHTCPLNPTSKNPLEKPDAVPSGDSSLRNQGVQIHGTSTNNYQKAMSSSSEILSTPKSTLGTSIALQRCQDSVDVVLSGDPSLEKPLNRNFMGLQRLSQRIYVVLPGDPFDNKKGARRSDGTSKVRGPCQCRPRRGSFQ